MTLPKKRIQAVIFDCDGTLVDSEHLHFSAWRHVASKRGMELTKETYATLAGNSVDYISQKLHEITNIDSAEAIGKDKVAFFKKLQKKGCPPIQRTLNFVKQLASQKHLLGIKLGVASAAHKDEILINLDHLGLTKDFDIVISGKDDLNQYKDPEGVNKPKPYIYLHVAKCLKLDPTQCVAFEDSSFGIASATNAGMITFAVPNEFTLHHDFSQASFIIEPATPLEIPKFFEMIKAN